MTQDLNLSGLPDPEETPLPNPLPTPRDSSIINTSSSAGNGLTKCVKCGASEVRLLLETGELQCLFCKHRWQGENAEQKFGFDSPIEQLIGTHMGSGSQNLSQEFDAVVTLKCDGCGADVVFNTESSLQARCHWCRQELNLNAQVPNGTVPDALLPFKITKEQAVEAIHQFAGKRELFAHRKFKKEFSPENVMGVYLPYMVIDGNLHAEIVGQGELETRSYTRKQGDDEVRYYDADIYSVVRKFDYIVDDLITESNANRSHMSAGVNTNNVINAILPFDVKNAVEFSAQYMGDFTSEKRDLDIAQLVPRAEDQFLSIAREKASASVKKYDRGVRWESERLDVYGSRWVSVYLPVWLYSYYEDRGSDRDPFVHYIAVNARTGKTMGSVPVNHPLLFAVSFGLGLAVFLATFFLVLGGSTASNNYEVYTDEDGNTVRSWHYGTSPDESDSWDQDEYLNDPDLRFEGE